MPNHVAKYLEGMDGFYALVIPTGQGGISYNGETCHETEEVALEEGKQ